MTERKRVGLDLSSFRPTEKPAEPLPQAITKIAQESGFRSTSSAPQSAPIKETSAPTPTRNAPVPKKVEESPVRVAFDVPKALRNDLLDGARRSGLGTVRAVILDALKAKGYKVPDDEILDKRTRR